MLELSETHFVCDQNLHNHLDYVLKNPQKHAMCWMPNQVMNLDLKGSTPAEKNHSSFRVALGRIGILELIKI